MFKIVLVVQERAKYGRATITGIFPRVWLGEPWPVAIICLHFLNRGSNDLLSRSLSHSSLKMDTQSRKTASAYINNLLLSRGLLRNGTPIAFAAPEQAEGGLDATMSQVMNLIHDLILRRDVRDHRRASKAFQIPLFANDYANSANQTPLQIFLRTYKHYEHPHPNIHKPYHDLKPAMPILTGNSH